MEKPASGKASLNEKNPETVSSTAAPPSPLAPPAPPPNGGLLAWLQVLGAAFLFFNSW